MYILESFVLCYNLSEIISVIVNKKVVLFPYFRISNVDIYDIMVFKNGREL